MSALKEDYLTLTEVRALIRVFEEKYGVSTPDFLRDAALRSSLPEDDVFKWEAYVDHLLELRQREEGLRREYLAKLSQTADGSTKTSPSDNQILLAA